MKGPDQFDTLSQSVSGELTDLSKKSKVKTLEIDTIIQWSIIDKEVIEHLIVVLLLLYGKRESF